MSRPGPWHEGHILAGYLNTACRTRQAEAARQGHLAPRRTASGTGHESEQLAQPPVRTVSASRHPTRPDGRAALRLLPMPEPSMVEGGDPK